MVEVAVGLVVQLLVVVDAEEDADEEEEDAFKTVKPRTAAETSTCFALSWTMRIVVVVVGLLVVI